MSMEYHQWLDTSDTLWSGAERDQEAQWQTRNRHAGSAEDGRLPAPSPSTAPHQSSAHSDLEIKTADGARRGFLAEFFRMGGNNLLRRPAPTLPQPRPNTDPLPPNTKSVSQLHLGQPSNLAAASQVM